MDVVSTFRRGSERGFEQPGQQTTLATGCSVAVCTYKRPASVNRLLDSLVAQQPQADQLIVVDASPDSETEESLRRRPDLDDLARSVLYFRVGARLRGLTRQRNFALDQVTQDLVAFFDDDIVLLPGCLGEMARIHRTRPERVVGVAAHLRNQAMKTTLLARLSLALGLVSTLEPGRYCRSGFAIPWEFSTSTAEFVEGQWLYATATMWRTHTARQVRFFDGFSGYGLGEDLDFSLRAAPFGAIGVAPHAEVLHLHDPNSRPSPFRLGYMEIFNRFQIQGRGLRDRAFSDVLWFAYAWGVDTLLLTRDFRVRARQRSTVLRLCGRAKGAFDALRGRALPVAAE